MIYLDTSVALAHLLSEDRCPPEKLRRETLISSRLLEYKEWNRIHARHLGRTHGDLVREFMGRIAFIELHSSGPGTRLGALSYTGANPG